MMIQSLAAGRVLNAVIVSTQSKSTKTSMRGCQNQNAKELIDILTLILWLVIGLINLLICDEISKLGYFCLWIVALIYIYKDISI